MNEFTTQSPKEKVGLKESASQLKTNATDYAKTYGKLVKAKFTRGASNAAAGLTIGVASLLFTVFFFIFLFTGIALWLGSLLGSIAAGFFCVAGFFFLLVVLVFALRRKVIIPFIRNTIISKLYE